MRKFAISNFRNYQMTPEIDSLIQKRIRELGFRLTPQRQLIMEAIERAGEHAAFDDIFDEVHQAMPSISQATVYRTLDLFSRYRLIHGNEVAKGAIKDYVFDSGVSSKLQDGGGENRGSRSQGSPG